MRNTATLVGVLALTTPTVTAQESVGGSEVPATADTVPVYTPERFPIGERLLYDVRGFGVLRLGRASMEIVGIDSVRGEPTLHVNFLLEGGMAFYQLRDVMESWIGLDDFTSRRFLQDFHEGGSHRVNDYAIFADSGFYRQEGRDTTFETSAHPLDDAAFFYFIRNVELEPGESYEFNNYFKPDRNPVILEVIKRDTLDLPAGDFAVLELKPIINGNGIFREAADARIWVTDDERRLVVAIESRFSFAKISLKLERIEGIPSPALRGDS